MALKPPHKKRLWSSEREDKPAIRPPDLTRPAQPALTQKEVLAPHANLRSGPSQDSGKSLPSSPGPLPFLRTRASFDILIHNPLSFPKRSLWQVRTLFYLLQLQIHGSRHLVSLGAPAQYDKTRKRVEEGRSSAVRPAPFLLRLRTSRTSWASRNTADTNYVFPT